MTKLNVEETLRLAGIDEATIPELVNKITESENIQKTQETFTEIKTLLMDAFTDADLNGVYPVSQIKKISDKLESIISPALETQEEALADIMFKQEHNKKPVTKFILEMNKIVQYKTYGLKNGFYVISADSQIGKTGWMIQLAVDALISNTKSNIIFITLDDSKSEIMNRFICAIIYRVLEDKMKDGKINTDILPEINCVPSGYSYWDDEVNQFVINESAEQIKRKATEIFLEYQLKRKIVIVDGMHGFSSIENQVFKNKGEKTLLIVDAAYNVNEHFRNDLEKDAKASLFFKLLPVKYGITVMAVKELSKKTKLKGSQIDESGDIKRGLADIGDTKGSVIWEYNSTAMATLYQYKDKICINFQKNKTSGRKFVRYYDQDWLKNAYRELDMIVKRAGEK